MLQEKCGKSLIPVVESWTSKTCSECNQFNRNLGANKTFNCKHCKVLIPRDVNGARNIFIKFSLMGATPL